MVRLTYLLTNIITLRSIVHLEKLRGIQIVKKFPALNGNRIFITAFTCTLHISWASSIQSLPSHPISWRSILTLLFHLRLGFSSDHYHSGFPAKSFIYISLPHTSFMSLPSNPSRLVNRKILCEEHRSLSSSSCRLFHSLVTSFILGQNNLLKSLFSNTLCSFTHPNKTVVEKINNFF